jgi:uncharacterized LabA/DUF88 family protein
MKYLVYIDVANIRYALIKSGYHINFRLLLSYLRTKYGANVIVKYYEGLALNDVKRDAEHEKLKSLGYDIHTVKRQKYFQPAKLHRVTCEKCGQINEIVVSPSRHVIKSNCDVALATDAMFDCFAHQPERMVFFAADGDYAQLFIKLIEKKCKVEVWAPYSSKANRSTSMKITELSRLYRGDFFFNNILDIVDIITKK